LIRQEPSEKAVSVFLHFPAFCVLYQHRSGESNSTTTTIGIVDPPAPREKSGIIYVIDAPKSTVHLPTIT